MYNPYKILAYITAYNDYQALSKCINCITNQSVLVKNIYIVDNSPVPLDFSDKQANVLVETYTNNVGVAGGMKLGIDHAIANEYDFIWLFDQDSEPEPNALEVLLDKYNELTSKGSKIGIISTLVNDINSKSVIPGYFFDKYKFVPVNTSSKSEKYYFCDAVITSGSLLNVNIAKISNPPRLELFLDAVDFDYSYEIKKLGYQIVISTEAHLNHHLGRYQHIIPRFSLNRSSIYTYSCSALRYYYACRNHSYIELKNTSSLVYSFKSIIYRIKLMLLMIIRIVNCEQHSLSSKILACLVGTFDGLTSNLQKSKF
jgi:rhamnosyltransferase